MSKKIIKFPSALVDHIEVPKITLGADPENNSDAVTKQYVDNKVNEGVRSITETPLTITDKTNSDTPDLVYVINYLAEGGTKGHDITATYTALPTKGYVDKKATGTVEYRGTTSAIPDPSTEIGKGDFYRISTAFDFGSEKAHVGDILLATKDNPAKNAADWDLIHTEVDSDTWVANSINADGYVEKTLGAANKVWKTDASGVPGWRDDANDSANDNTTYDLSAAKNKSNGYVTIDLTAGGSGSGIDSVKVQGNSATTVTTDDTGVITISSNNNNQTIKGDGKTFGADAIIELVAGTNIAISGDSTNSTITINATDTTYTSKPDASSGTEVSLVTTGEKYTWNNKQDAINSSNKLAVSNISGLAIVATSGSYTDLTNKPTIITSYNDLTDKPNIPAAYSLPEAGTALGGVKSGGDVTISGGVITVNDDSHNHTIANVDGLQDALDAKAGSSHGAHVPTPQAANNKTFLRNDNSWQEVTPANIGAATSDHNHDNTSPTFATVTAQSFNATSDIRLKENFEVLRPERSILELPTYKFDFINGAKNQIGCKAQDLQEICPEIVVETNDGYLSIQESKIVYLLLEEVKKLKAELEILKNKD
jgi:hypothetical protein